MATFQIEGGQPLKGAITPQGAKNEALQVLAAVLMTSEKITLHNIPNIRDVNKLIGILEKIGVTVENLGRGSYSFQSTDIDFEYLKSQKFREDGGSLRGSILTVGPLLGRFKQGYVIQPGGDKIGRRRLDTHFEGFIKLGGQLTYNKEQRFYSIKAPDGLQGSYMLLEEASVTGTANIIMAAVFAEGETTIYNAACEPYIQQLCTMLTNMGAKISGIGSNLIKINGVKNLQGCEHTIWPDMIEIGSWIGLAAMTKSEITIKGAGWENLGLIPEAFHKLGIKVEKKGNDIHIPAHTAGYEVQNFRDGSIMNISDAPWPGLTPDLISIILVVASQAKGSVLIHQKMFESRLFFVDKLIEMGAKIILCDPHRATVIGHNFETSLRATTMTSPDIRAGISLLIAALSADGVSTIHNIEQIDRGYERIDQRLRQLGAKIKRI